MANIFCSFQNDSTPTRTTTKLLLGPLSVARGQKLVSTVLHSRTIYIIFFALFGLKSVCTYAVSHVGMCTVKATKAKKGGGYDEFLIT